MTQNLLDDSRAQCEFRKKKKSAPESANVHSSHARNHNFERVTRPLNSLLLTITDHHHIIPPLSRFPTVAIHTVTVNHTR